MLSDRANKALFQSAVRAEKKFQSNDFNEINARLDIYRNNKSKYAVTRYKSVGGVVLAE